MCKAMEDYTLKTKILGVIDGMKLTGASESDIIEKITETFGITKDYVLFLLKPQEA